MDNGQFNQGEPSESQRLAKSTSGTRRVNNMPLIIAGGVLALFLILVAMVAMDRANRVKSRVSNDDVGSVDKGLAEQVLGASGGRTGGLVGAQDDTPVLPIAKVDNLDLPPLPPPPEQEDPELSKLYAAKLAMFEKAVGAATQVTGSVKGAGAPPTMAQSTGGQGGDLNAGATPAVRGRSASNASNTSDPTSGDVPREGYSQFDKIKGKDRWMLDSSLEAPRSRYELRAGFVIPGIMLSGINSELPGQIIAQVSQDVYDTATGKYRLIPQGTRLVGTYDAKVVYGQSRVLIAWQRLVFPDGKAMDIGSMPGADAGGYSGFNDKVNNHYMRIFGSALLLSGIVAGVNTSQTNPRNDPFGTSTQTVMSQAIAQEIGQTASNLLQKNINIAPTLEIRPGYRFNVMVVKDLDFDKPYQPFDY
jgi:type IV secretion system protein TrbI